MNKHDLEYYLSLNYKIIVTQRANKYFLEINELELIESGETLIEAYNRLMESKNQFIKNSFEQNEVELIPLPVSKILKNRWGVYEAKKFFTKSIIVTFCILVVIALIFDLLRPTAESFNKLAARIIRITADIKNNQDLSPERIQIQAMNFHETMRAGKPYFQEFKNSLSFGAENNPEIGPTEEDYNYLSQYIKQLKLKYQNVKCIDGKNSVCDKLKETREFLDYLAQYTELSLKRGNIEDYNYCKGQLKIFIDRIRKVERNNLLENDLLIKKIKLFNDQISADKVL